LYKEARLPGRVWKAGRSVAAGDTYVGIYYWGGFDYRNKYLRGNFNSFVEYGSKSIELFHEDFEK
jgi:hypothetical protein